jgi:superfamily II DNA or RNA helicase
MMKTPAFTEKDRKKAAALLQDGKVDNLLFSEGTYQVSMKGKGEKETFWPFLQCDDAGRILDAFCTCSEVEKQGSCPHLAAFHTIIFNGKSLPLHVRFRDSLWNMLCQIASRRHGFHPKCLKKAADGGYQATSDSGKVLFAVKGLTPRGKKRLQEILFDRPSETEETSLKFSNLPPEEIALWKQGRPSFQLQYSLSFWSDLAKWWMLLQEEGKPYELTFGAVKDDLPREIKLRFADVEAKFYIAEVNWVEMIPSLRAVNSPLPVIEFQEEPIQEIRYDPVRQELQITHLPLTQRGEFKRQQDAKHIQLGDWIFVPKEGFYPSKIDPVLKEAVIPKERIASVLYKHAPLINQFLVGTEIHSGTHTAQYNLFFDDTSRLHLECYVTTPGDLKRPHSTFFNEWCYVDGEGFYLLESVMFPQVETVIPKENVSDFVNRHRVWLNQYDGFQTHVSSVESHFTFTLTKQGLRFDTRLDLSEEEGDILDFGEWIYVKGRGFYAKASYRMGWMKPGMLVPPGDISRFIRLHRDELETLRGFFSTGQPLEKSGLNLTLTEQKQIQIVPEYQFKLAYRGKQVQIFGDFLYVEGEGFSEIPPDLKLAEGYSEPKIIDAASEPYFVAYELDNLQPFIRSIDPSLIKPATLFLRINRIRRDDSAKQGQWILDLEYESEVGHVPVFTLWQAIEDHERYLFSPAGLIILKNPRFNWLKMLSKKRWSKGGTQLRLTTLEWIRLTVFEDLRPPKVDLPYAEETQKALEELLSFQTHLPIDLTGLESSLRPYQEIGVKWLWFLYCHGLSGLLCDEMGLGKTHQAMALLTAVMNSSPDSDQKYLVVCPTSVIYHWEELLKRFLPKMRVCVFYGAQRTLDAFQTHYDLLLTSYGTLRSERKALAKIPFTLAIYDEIQIAKNIRSQTHRAMRMIDAKMRLGLTGTPIENRILELKALFDLILPGYFPQDSSFKEFFVNPIEKSQDPERKALLSRLIKPFILRRKKTEVLLELPEKIEEIAYCSLSDEQRELYQKTYRLHKDSLMRDLQDESKPAPLIHVFALLSELKQICDHPCLITKQFQEIHQHQSGKWDLFVELLQEARESGQKVVVFSQYLNMLDIIESYLNEQRIGFAGIRGSTRDRKEQLEKFRTDPRCEVFVASLQAAGVGIELTAASVVIHYDRWWNPARENQATDRVHRMGQNHGVQVFKMVTKGTIEEHIHQIIERKMGLLEGVIGFDEQDHIKGLDRQELIQLLQLLDYQSDKNN